MLPWDAAPVSHGEPGTTYQARPAYLIDMRSRSGYSGSPVFGFRVVSYDLRNFNDDNSMYTVDLGTISEESYSTFIGLLGVHCAQFHEDIVVQQDSSGIPGARLRIPSSMSVVIPAWRITALLDDEKLTRRRAMRDAARISGDTRVARSEGERS